MARTMDDEFDPHYSAAPSGWASSRLKLRTHQPASPDPLHAKASS
jgi:hypothetical protein